MVTIVSDFDSMDELIKEIEKGESSIIITKDIRKFRKPVTLISGVHDDQNARDVTRRLKSTIGTGGTFKDGQIILQGDHREIAKAMLVKMGFKEESIEVY